MLRTMADLAQLDELSEESIQKNLKERFLAKNIYTYVGDILIAVNPYEHLPCYSKEYQQKYLKCKREDNDPHIYFVAYNAYESMLRNKDNQAFVISGESGAGKTETTKHVVNHVIELCKAGNKELETRITQLNPLIEAFGNAKTVMNNNSSRFGKFLELKFDNTGAVHGAQISEYLLEKSRVTLQAPNEQNYHVFYILLSGLTDSLRSQLGIGTTKNHAYVNGPGCPADAVLYTEENAKALPELLETFRQMGFEQSDVDSVQKQLAAILLIGDTKFAEGADEAAVFDGTTANIEKACELIQVDFPQMQAALLTTSSRAAGDTITRNHTRASAAENRDSLTRAMYARLFGWLITFCNTNLINQAGLSQSTLTLGILDIFGFEDFATNSLEQLCINITNENLQFFFAHLVFSMEQAEYAAQGVSVERIEFEDNKPILDVLVGKPKGVLLVLDEESRFPKATDISLTQKISVLKAHPSNAVTPPSSDRDAYFSVSHYAGAVKYTTTGFLNKNRDALSQDIVTAMRFSADDLVGAMWTAPKSTTGTFRVTRGSKPAARTKKAPATVANQFMHSLQDLMHKIEASKPHFVRCIKPNKQKKAALWESELVTRQLKYSGVLETVRIRKLGYSVRDTFVDFVNRYQSIAFPLGVAAAPTKESCETILKVAHIEDYEFGTEKVFMKYYHPERLSAALRVKRQALDIVKMVCRGLVCRVRYRHILAAKRAQTTAVAATFEWLETHGLQVANSMVKFTAEDVKAAEKRKWVKSIRRKKEKEEKERVKREAAEQAKLEKEQNAKFMTKKRGKVGNHVFVRNEQLTKRVGKLPEHWEKKLDATTQRFYYKNHLTRETTWIDPRTAQTRKTSAKECAGDELPYGWDEAEINGEVYYIDHINQKTHWAHPRLVLEEMREDYVNKEEEVQARADAVRGVIKEYRDKRSRLVDSKKDAAEGDMDDLEKRIEAMDAVIDAEVVKLRVITSENAALKKDIKDLKTQFGQAAYAEEHGGDASAFVGGDITDLYAVEKNHESLPHKLDTMTREQLKALREKVTLAAASGGDSG